MEPEEVNDRLSRLVDDFQLRAAKNDGIIPDQAMAVIRKLVDLAKYAVPEDEILQVIEIPEAGRYSDLYPILRQVELALPSYPPFSIA